MLAGGRSTRFGRDKLAEPYRGTSLLEHAVSALAPVCAEVVVVLAPVGPEPRTPPGVPVRLARDAVEGQGPLMGLAAGLSGTRTETAVVIGGDMPEPAPGVLLLMLGRIDDPGVVAVALEDGERFRPLPCVLRVGPARDAAAELVGRGERRLRSLLETLRAAVVLEPTWRALDPSGRTLFDVDEPGDLET
ncbi:MAG: molybdenum cofactor guanylyltransferase [Candidatus Velamenicoccus archaeovorus]